MSFLDLGFLWLLPLALLPIVIHLLNRMRYEVKSWAAFDFLMSSQKRSKAINRLRHILILLFRVLMLLSFIFALARPIVGGWIGQVFAGSPENVIIIFDRSASMGAIPAQSGLSKFDKSLKLIKELSKQYSDTHFILLDSASGEIKPLKNLSYLYNNKSFSVTETYAPLPKLVNKAIDFYKNDNFGKTEIWIVSDYQKSNWNKKSPRWKNLTKYKEDDNLSFRLFLAGEKLESNVAIRIQKAYPIIENGKYYLYLNCQLIQNKRTLNSLILSFNVNGIEDKLPISLQGATLEFKHRIEISKEVYNSGYGFVELPFDSQQNDNRYYFAYSKANPFYAAVISSSEERAQLLELLTNPYKDNLNYQSESFYDFAPVVSLLDKISLLILDGVQILPQYEENLLRYIERGGYVLIMPPLLNGSKILKTFKLDKIQEFEEGGIGISYWEKNFGPFAKSSFGKSLPLHNLIINRRQIASGGIVLAEYADGLPFISRHFYGLGAIYYCSTSIDSKWSNLDQGAVILPMLHKMMDKANERFSNIKSEFLGENILKLKLLPVLKHSSSKLLLHGGIYKNNQYSYELNRPPLEDDFEAISKEAIESLFKDIDLDSSFEEKSDEDIDEISNLWTFFISLILIFMFGEALITLGHSEKIRKVI